MRIVLQNLTGVADECLRIGMAGYIPRHIVCGRLRLAHDVRDAEGGVVEQQVGPALCLGQDGLLGQAEMEADRDDEDGRHQQNDGESEPDGEAPHEESHNPIHIFNIWSDNAVMVSLWAVISIFRLAISCFV